MYQRFFSAKSPKIAKQAAPWWALGVMFFYTMVTMISVVSRSVWPDIDPQMAILHPLSQLPPFFAAFLLITSLSIIITTADSFLLATASNIGRDIYQKFINPKATNDQVLKITRIFIVIVAVVAYIQITYFPTVLDLIMYSYTMYGAGITPALLASFCWKRANSYGATASMLTGMVLTLVWEFANEPLGIPTTYPALIGSIVVLVIVSVLTPPPSSASIEPFFKDQIIQDTKHKQFT